MSDPIRAIRDNWTIIEAMVKRNIAGRYRNSHLGLLWGVITPILLMLAVYVVFTSVKMIHPGENFWVYLSAGIFAMTGCTYCLRGRAFFNNANYVKKMAIPRWVEVFADALAQFVMVAISYVILIIAIVIAQYPMDISIILFLPLELILMFLFCLGISFIISTLSVVCGDVGHLMSVVSRVVIWLTPVFFFIDSANETLATVVKFNPFTYFIEPLHQTLYFHKVPDIFYFGTSVILVVVALLIGWLVFSHYEKKLAEML